MRCPCAGRACHTVIPKEQPGKLEKLERGLGFMVGLSRASKSKVVDLPRSRTSRSSRSGVLTFQTGHDGPSTLAAIRLPVESVADRAGPPPPPRCYTYTLPHITFPREAPITL